MKSEYTLSGDDRRHREDFKTFVLHNAEYWYREHLGKLYNQWETWNERFFGGSMVAPYLMFSEPGYTRAYGDCSVYSGFGGKSQIRIRPSLLLGTHRAVRHEDKFAEGRFRFVEDVLLHEMIHQYQQEVIGKRENAYKGHGPIFRDNCNRIAEDLGLPQVRIAKARGKAKNLPSCAHWPHCVRPTTYYMGAVINPGGAAARRDPDELTDEDGAVENDLVKADQMDRTVFALAAAAQCFARAWPVGTESEAAEGYVNRWITGGSSAQKALHELLIKARAFNTAFGA